jgi:segregation and condensation protein B
MSEEVADWSLKRVIESILFASQRPVSTKDLQGILKNAAEAEKTDLNVTMFSTIKEAALRAALDELGAECADPSRAYELRETAAGWQLVTKPQFSPWLRQLFPEYRSARLSAPAMETLAIIAYRQPITRADIEAIRGVAVDGVLQTLLDRGLVKISGRADLPGRPLLYETTQNFMDHFGLRNLDELPNVTELRKIHLPPPASTSTQPAMPESPTSSEAIQHADAPASQNTPPEDQPS